MRKPQAKSQETWSPNRRPRPAGTRIRVIVLHSTGGTFRSAVNWLMNPSSGVSSHYVISRAGETRKLVPLSDRAFHAGRSKFAGSENVNDFSIGIEMEHVDGKQGWPVQQVDAVAKLCAELLRAYGKIKIVSHRSIAIPPGRKVDPVGFPWDEFSEAVKEAGA